MHNPSIFIVEGLHTRKNLFQDPANLLFIEIRANIGAKVVHVVAGHKLCNHDHKMLCLHALKQVYTGFGIRLAKALYLVVEQVPSKVIYVNGFVDHLQSEESSIFTCTASALIRSDR